ncbi:MAG: PAS domain S-box protein [Alphaproteobacteria bacterium]|nr:PAS domain S-box protein [Alphaproteobacteria bacterium]MBV9693484.1 PAS domain S-box protein [Alphaproteobacteria bacterium]
MPASEVLFQALIATSVDGIIMIDEDGLVLVYNDACARMFGYAADEVIGRNVNMLMPSPYHAEHDGYLARYRKTGEKRIIGIGREVLGRRKNGTTFAMYLSVGEGVFHDRRIFMGILHDISARKASERQIQELQKELLHAARLTATGQLSAALAHELNQPLTAILNYVGILQEMTGEDKGPGGEMLREVSARIAEQTTRAGEIIRRIRGFVAKREPDRSILDLNAVVRDAVALGFVGAADSSIKLETAFAPDLPAVLMDKVQIQQVVINLVRNAVEAMQNSPERRLQVATCCDRDGFVQLRVADTGPGLAPEIAASLFQPFVTTKEQGLGIGLSICRTIVEAHGGRLWMELGMGGGAVFQFRLPVAQERATADGK